MQPSRSIYLSMYIYDMHACTTTFLNSYCIVHQSDVRRWFDFQECFYNTLCRLKNTGNTKQAIVHQY